MINYHETIVNTLSDILPTYYEMVLHSGIKTPCISYMELNNSVNANGTTIGYSDISYQIKVWGNKLEDLQNYSMEIDKAMRALGWTRYSSQELHDNQSTMMQKILTYGALASETF